MMPPRGGPLLNFSFYCEGVSASAALAGIVTSLLGLRATFHSATGTRASGGVTEDIGSEAALRCWLADAEGRLEGVALKGATDTSRTGLELVSYAWISEAAARSDHPAIAIETAGQWTEHWVHKGGEKLARTLGRRAKRRFCSLVEVVRPAYAAILVERFLPCPVDLLGYPQSRTFSDFFVSGSYVGAARLERLATLFGGAYVERVADGLFISCYEFLNPKGLSLAWDGGERSEQAARLIATARRHPVTC